MSGDPVVVVGASGNLGAATVRALAARGLPVRVTGTDVAVLERRFPGVAAARLDLTDPSTFPGGVSGASGLFLVRPPAIASVGPTLNALVDVAAAHGVGHVVFSSVSGAETNRIVPHHRVETHLRASSVSWTILRPGFFAQNLADAYRCDISTRDRIYLPAGRGKAAFVDTRDVGEVAAAVFAEPEAHRGAGYLLTGPEALGFDEVAQILSGELGRTITYQPASVAGYLRHVRREGLRWPKALVQTVLHTDLRRGSAEKVDPTLAQLLDHEPRRLADYVHDHRDTWEAATS